MSIQFSSEQIEFKNSFHKFLSKEWSSEILRKYVNASPQQLTNIWEATCSFGLPELFGPRESPEDPGARELGLLSYEAGYFLAPEQVVIGAFAGSYLWNRLLSDADRQVCVNAWGTTLGALLESGDLKVGVAVESFHVPIDLDLRGSSPNARAQVVFNNLAYGTHLPGLILFAGTNIAVTNKAACYVANLQVGKEQQVIVSRQNSADISTAYGHFDLRNVHCLELQSVAVELIWQNLASILANELAGVAARSVEATVEYVKTRRQFDAPIGSFQAVQHRLADMYLQAEAVRSLAAFAAWANAHSPEQAALVSRSALVYACEQVPLAVEGAIQLHGGIGFTWECDLHLLLRRAKTYELLYGGKSTDYQQILSLAQRAS